MKKSLLSLVLAGLASAVLADTASPWVNSYAAHPVATAGAPALAITLDPADLITRADGHIIARKGAAAALLVPIGWRAMNVDTTAGEVDVSTLAGGWTPAKGIPVSVIVIRKPDGTMVVQEVQQ